MSFEKITFPEDSVFLVTGGAGFIGSNVAEAILKKGYQVRVLDNLSTGHIENIQPYLEHPDFTFIQEDIRNLDACLKATEGVDYVINLAAWGSVPRSIEMPLLYEEINIRGTLNMMEASRQNGVKAFCLCFQFLGLRRFHTASEEGGARGQAAFSLCADEEGG